MQMYMPASSTFDMIDRNHDGVITRSEFSQVAMMPTVTYAAAAAPGAVLQQAVTMQPHPVVYSAPQLPIVYEQAAAPVMFSGQPQAIYSTTQPAQIAHEQTAPATGAITSAAAPAAQVIYQQASIVTCAAPAASPEVYEQSVPAVTCAATPVDQVTDEQTSTAVTHEEAPVAQVTDEQAAPALTHVVAPAPVHASTPMSYPASAAPQAAAQATCMSATAPEQPALHSLGSSVQSATEQSVPAAGSTSVMAVQPAMLTFVPPMIQPQAAYYQVGGMQAVAVQPQVTYGTTAPGIQTMMMEQQPVAQPFMAMTVPHMQQVTSSKQTMTVPAGATLEQSVAMPQQTEAVAVPVTEQPAVVTGKKTKKKLTTKEKGKACC